ncbi:hypothetical protein J2S53_000203 [Actinopolyspora lacussalsi]|nr:hypothetical protein [Actinopolyspora lacussalsi]
MTLPASGAVGRWKPFRDGFTPFEVTVQHHSGVAVGVEAMAATAQPTTQLGVVVGLPAVAET